MVLQIVDVRMRTLDSNIVSPILRNCHLHRRLLLPDFVTAHWLKPVAYDSNDEVVKSNTLHYSQNKIKVRAKVLENKTIPVRVSVTGTPAAGYEYVETECLPQEIQIAGSEKKIDRKSVV